MLREHPAVPDIDTTPFEGFATSLVPAVDEVIERFTDRSLVTSSEVIDALLDLRLVAAAADIANH
jgi:hypothetical protein